MGTNQIVEFKPEQGLASNLLSPIRAKHVRFTEESQMCMEKHILVKENIHKFAKPLLSTMKLSKRTESDKEKVQWSVKKVMLTSFFDMKGNHHYPFPLKKVQL